MLPGLAAFPVGNWALVGIVEAALLRGIEVPYATISALLLTMPAQCYDTQDWAAPVRMASAGLFSDAEAAAAELSSLMPKTGYSNVIESVTSALAWSGAPAAQEMLNELAGSLEASG